MQGRVAPVAAVRQREVARRPLAEQRASDSSIEDTRRGMSRGTNQSPPRVTIDTRREQEAQVGRQKVSAITRSTGLRRRWRRFESYRGHHILPAYTAQR